MAVALLIVLAAVPLFAFLKRTALCAQAEDLNGMRDLRESQRLRPAIHPLLKTGNFEFDGPPASPAHDMMVMMPVAAQAVEDLAMLTDGIQLAILRHDLQIAIHRSDADMAAFRNESVVHRLHGGEGVVFLQLLHNQHSRPGNPLYHGCSAFFAKSESVPFECRHALYYM
jgi:hypothetical protein